MLPPFEKITAATAMRPTPIQIAHQSSLRKSSFQAEAPSGESRFARATISVTWDSSGTAGYEHKPIALWDPIEAGHDRLPIGYKIACARPFGSETAQCHMIVSQSGVTP